LYPHPHVHTHTHTHTHTHKHIHIHTHTHTHTHTQQGYTALIAAAESQHENIVEVLIEVHADPDLQDEVIGYHVSLDSTHGISMTV